MVEPERPDRRIRIGTQEREAAIRALGERMAAGYLDTDEYTERVDRAVSARTMGDLDELFVDLPGSPHRPPPPLAAPPALPRPPLHPGHPMYPPPVVGPHAPFGVDAYGRPLSDRSRLATGLLQILLPVGIGRFYAGDAGTATAQLLLSVFCGVGVIWCLIDGIVILAQGGTDGYGRQLHD